MTIHSKVKFTVQKRTSFNPTSPKRITYKKNYNYIYNYEISTPNIPSIATRGLCLPWYCKNQLKLKDNKLNVPFAQTKHMRGLFLKLNQRSAMNFSIGGFRALVARKRLKTTAFRGRCIVK